MFLKFSGLRALVFYKPVSHKKKSVFESGGLFIQVNSRVAPYFFSGTSEQIKNIYLYYISTNYILYQYRLYYKSCIP